MSDFLAFLRLGFHHIVEPAALDHLLFLVALVAPYRFRDWRHLVGVATAFTLGHSITLGLVVSDAVHVPAAVIEFLIPVTIVWAGLENLRRIGQRPAGWARPALAAGFGLIHGAGFAAFLGEMFPGSPAMPLFAFNVGIELAQITVLVTALALLTVADLVIHRMAPAQGIVPRAVATSLIAAACAAVMAFQRTPW